MNFFKLFTLFFIISLSTTLNAKEIIVTKTTDTGVAGEFRWAVGQALANDTIIINVKGIINLASAINFNTSNITIIGPYPKHNTFTSTASIIMFNISADSIVFQGLGFKDAIVQNVIKVSVSSNINFINCLFENNASALSGNVYMVNSSGKFINCSFINNTSNHNGGAIYITNSAAPSNEVHIINSTFYGNQSFGTDGGAIYCNAGYVFFYNNLFTNNSTSAVGGQAISATSSTNTTFYNNVFFLNGGTSDIQINLNSGNPVENSNRIVLNSGETNPFGAGSNVNIVSLLGLTNNLIEDGYGLKYYRIIDNTSVLLNTGTTVVSPTLTGGKDCRRAPRTLEGTIDIGPCEYTPYRVTNLNNSGTGSLRYAINSLTGSTENFIEFYIPSFNPQTPITLSSSLSILKTVYIDGYSQPGTAIAGPGIMGSNGVTPADSLIQITGTPTFPGYSVKANNVTISGFELYGLQFGIDLTNSQATDAQIFGNHIGFYDNGSSYIVSENKKNGLNVGRANINIGGNEHWQRNVITGNGQTGTLYPSNIYCNFNATNLKIFGNFIGTHPNGLGNLGVSSGTADGIYIYGNNANPPTVNIGGIAFGQKNIISLNRGNGIYATIGQNTNIDNNNIGLSYDGLSSMGNELEGINIVSSPNTTPLNIGTNKGNLISGNTLNGVKIINSQNVTLVNNIIGLGIDSTIQANQENGILIDNSSNIYIGNSTNGNIISGNTQQGIKAINGSATTIMNNRIGTSPAGTVARANGFSGIQIESCLLTQITNNLISGNTQNGIFLTETSTNTTIKKNKIGTKVTGNSALANGWNGIHILNTHKVTIGSFFPDNNLISGNTLNGILVESPNVTIDGNIIGLNTGGTAALGNGANGVFVKTGGNTTQIGGGNSNYIGGNTLNGIAIDGADSCKINNCNIGEDLPAIVALPNLQNGISIQNAFRTEVGNQFSNTIIGHTNSNMAGVLIEDSDSTLVVNNYIGITANDSLRPNNFGVYIKGNSEKTEIGNIFLTDKNFISGNTVGVLIDGSGAKQNYILGNIIGLNNAGSAGAPNGVGIEISNDAEDNHIGKSTFLTKRNLISSNTIAGIYIHDGAHNNTIYSNLIGTNSNDDSGLANTTGVWIKNCTVTNHIGSASHINDKPIISGNTTGILIDNSQNQFVRNCRIGTKANGLVALPNVNGIVIQNGSDFNVIGGNTSTIPMHGNLISGNTQNGISINDGDENWIYGNKIGSTPNGLSSLSNDKGIYISGGFKNLIGNNTSGEGNLIIANTTAGIHLDNNADSILVRNNQIGIVGIYNATGVLITSSLSKFSIIGGDRTLNEGNVFIDNGVDIGISNSDYQKIEGNTFGFNQTGTLASGSNNNSIGIYLNNSNNNSIGSTVTNKENSIINKAVGIFVDNSDNNVIQNSFIGNNYHGTSSLGATNQVGIRIDSASTNNIIKTNVISGNVNGIIIRTVGTNANIVKNNKIGVDVVGNTAIANTNAGITISNGAQNNIIGGVVNDQNIISGNSFGVKIDGTNTSLNKISGNLIGLNVAGNTSIPNSYAVFISNYASSNSIGGIRNSNNFISETNTISGNGSAIILSQSTNNIISGNNIGTNLNGSATISNTAAVNDHIAFLSSSNNNQFGGSTPDSTNYIVGAATSALYIGINSNSNKVVGNKFGELPDGTNAANSSHAILIDGSNSNIIGSLNSSDLINDIENSGGDGVSIIGTSNNNMILHNSIHDNDSLAIDINDDGVTTNNASGIQNNVQMPVILQASDCNNDGDVEVALQLRNLTPGQNYIIEFYNNTSTPDPTTYGEADFFINQFTYLAINSVDTAVFNIGSIASSQLISASLTALGGNGGTSEMSQNFGITTFIGSPTITVIAETCQGSNNGNILIDDNTNSEYYYFALSGETPLFNPTFDSTFVLPAGTYTITSKTLNGCVFNSSQIINSGGTPTFSTTVVDDTCGLFGQYTVSQNNSVGVNPNYYQVGPPDIQLTGGNQTALSVGTYQVYMITNISGVVCTSDTSTITINSFSYPQNDLEFTYSMCSTSNGYVSLDPIKTGGMYSSNPNGINASTGEINNPINGTYDITYTVGNTCIYTLAGIIPSVPLDATFTMATNDSICFGELYTVSPVNTGGVFDFSPNPSDGTTIDGATGVISNYSTNTYQIRYITNSSCADTVTKPFVVLSLPQQPNITTTDSVICENENLVDIYTSPTVNVSWLRNPTDFPFLTDANAYLPQDSDIQTGDNYFYAYVVDANGCFSPYDSINIKKIVPTNMVADNDVEICLGSEVTIGASGAYSYYWPTVNNGSSEQTVTVQPTVLTNYAVVLKDINGCEVFDTVVVSIKDPSECDIEINTAFSPNGDGINDTWIIKSIEGYPENIVYIYNRWGDVVSKIENYDNQQNVWNGENKFTTKIVAPGTYFYVVEAGGEKTLSGWAQVVK